MILDIIINNIARIGIKFHFTRELDFRAACSRRRTGGFISESGDSKNRNGSKAEQQIRS